MGRLGVCGPPPAARCQHHPLTHAPAHTRTAYSRRRWNTSPAPKPSTRTCCPQGSTPGTPAATWQLPAPSGCHCWVLISAMRRGIALPQRSGAWRRVLWRLCPLPLHFWVAAGCGSCHEVGHSASRQPDSGYCTLPHPKPSHMHTLRSQPFPCAPPPFRTPLARTGT